MASGLSVLSLEARLYKVVDETPFFLATLLISAFKGVDVATTSGTSGVLVDMGMVKTMGGRATMGVVVTDGVELSMTPMRAAGIIRGVISQLS